MFPGGGGGVGGAAHWQKCAKSNVVTAPRSAERVVPLALHNEGRRFFAIKQPPTDRHRESSSASSLNTLLLRSRGRCVGELLRKQEGNRFHFTVFGSWTLPPPHCRFLPRFHLRSSRWRCEDAPPPDEAFRLRHSSAHSGKPAATLCSALPD